MLTVWFVRSLLQDDMKQAVNRKQCIARNAHLSRCKVRWRRSSRAPVQTMCFFANNQYRIIVEGSKAGSDNLEDVFEKNLKRIGRMVAILDTWDQPVYLSRVWTVYEQFVASTLQIQVGAENAVSNRKPGNL